MGFLTRIWASGIVQQQYNADSFMYGLRMKKKKIKQKGELGAVS